MRAELAKIEAATDKKHTDLHLMLSEVKVLAMKLENKQRGLLQKGGTLRDLVHEASLDCRRYGREEMHRIATRQDAKSWSQDLPNGYFIRTLHKLNERMENVTKVTTQLEHVMASVVQEKEARRTVARHGGSSSGSTSLQSSSASSLVNSHVPSTRSSEQLSGQLSVSTDDKLAAKTRVGPKQLHRIMQLQMQAFMSITANVADLHHTVTDMRLAFLAELNAPNKAANSSPGRMDVGYGDNGSSSPGGMGSSRGGGYSGSVSSRQQVDPFEAADWAEKRRVASKQKRVDDIISDGSSGGAMAMQAGAAAAAAASASASASASAAAGALTGLSSIPAPSSGFGAVLAPTAKPTAGTSVGFGASTPVGLGAPAAAAAATGGFGAPAAGTAAIGGFGAPAASPAAGGFGAATPAPGAFGAGAGSAGDLAVVGEKKPGGGSRNRRRK